MIKKFMTILKNVHEKMENMEKNLNLGCFSYEKEYEGSERRKKKMEQNICAKLSFFNIRKRYTECLIQTSLCHYNKLK